MRCSKAHRLIGEKLEGTIGAQDLAELKKHLEQCADCGVLIKDFERLAEDARTLPKKEPSGRVWTAIVEDLRKARREPERRPALKPRWLDVFGTMRRARWAWAAALTLVIVGGLAIGLRPWSGSGPAGSERETLAKLKEAEKHYRLAIEALSDAISSQKTNLDPQTAALFAQNLRDVDSVIHACRDAVQKNPNNLDVRVYLLDAYKDKVEFLGRIVDAGKNNASARRAEAKI
jgi:anti-sigma factor RsiW